jgi:hypothetical protein
LLPDGLAVRASVIDWIDAPPFFSIHAFFGAVLIYQRMIETTTYQKSPMRIFHWNICLPLGLLALLASGCATPSLWDRTSAFEWKPGAPVNVLLPAGTNQSPVPTVLFSQNATVNHTFMQRRVGWRVDQSPDALAVTAGAIQTLTNSAAGFQAVPVYSAVRVPTNVSSVPPGYAVMNYTSHQLTLHVDGVPAGPYTLPGGAHPQNNTERAVLTPFAVILDVPMCAFGAVVYVLLHV